MTDSMMMQPKEVVMEDPVTGSLETWSWFRFQAYVNQMQEAFEAAGVEVAPSED